jgi:hypothetical protein
MAVIKGGEENVKGWRPALWPAASLARARKRDRIASPAALMTNGGVKEQVFGRKTNEREGNETPDTQQKYREEYEQSHNPSRQLALDLTAERAPRVSDNNGGNREVLGKELGKEVPAKK